MKLSQAAKQFTWFINAPLNLVGFVLRLTCVFWLWEWYVVPLGVMSITPVHAFGLIMVVNILWARSVPYVEGGTAEVYTDAVLKKTFAVNLISIIISSVSLGLGALGTQWM